MSYIFGSRSTRLSPRKSTDAQGITRAYQHVHEILELEQSSGVAVVVRWLLRPIMPPGAREEFCSGRYCYLFPDRLQSATFSFPASTTSHYFVSPTSDAVCTSIPQRLLTLTACCSYTSFDCFQSFVLATSFASPIYRSNLLQSIVPPPSTPPPPQRPLT